MKIHKGVRDMKRYPWQATVSDYRGEVQEQIDCSSYGEACELIGDIAQRKLLEYLIAHPDKGEWTEEEKQDCIKIRTLKSMLKQLEEKCEECMAELRGLKLMNLSDYLYDNYIDSLLGVLGECGHRQPTDPITTCDINGKPCLLEENLPCDMAELEVRNER